MNGATRHSSWMRIKLHQRETGQSDSDGCLELSIMIAPKPTVCFVLVGCSIVLLGAGERVEVRSPIAASTARMAATTRVSTMPIVPLDFVENQGQWQTPARFVARKASLV